MGKAKEKMENTGNDAVKKQTLIMAVLFSLFIGFVGGTVYSSFKLAADKGTQPPQAMVSQEKPQDSGQADAMAQIAAKALKLEQYLKENPEDVKAWINLGNHLFDLDQHAGAIDAYQKSLVLEPGNVSVMTDLGTMYRRNKQPQKAIEIFNKAITLDPSFETARFNKGVVLLHDLNDVEAGIKAWEELVVQNPMAMAPNGESVDAIIQRIKNKE